MDERFVKKFIAPSFLIVVLSALFFYKFKFLIDYIFFKKKHILIIGILSAPENFQQRLSIRKTWLQLLSEISGSSYFIIGNEICEVPILDRPDPYTCISRPFDLPPYATAASEFSTMKFSDNISVSGTQILNSIGFSFYVRSQIQVKKLGILKELMILINDKIEAKLISAFNKTVFATATFNPELLNETSDIIAQTITPTILYDHSEALLIISSKGLSNKLLPECNLALWADGPKVINYVNLWQLDSAMPIPFTYKSCTYVSMFYSLADIEGVKNSIKNRNLRFKKWHLHNKKLSLKLSNESALYNDLMFLDVIDVYRNISLKMIHFYKRILETEYFHYILKTDDDSFIDLLRIDRELKVVNEAFDNELGEATMKNKKIDSETKYKLSKFWWWSFFREFWRVQHSGKWRENQYRSASYPSFPCGGGYVINKGIVDYIVSNEQYLNHFQGEDVSMGIWLSSLSVIQHKTHNVIFNNKSHELQKKIFTKYRSKDSWFDFKKKSNLVPDICAWTCDNQKHIKLPLCNKVQMTVKDMYDTWNEYKRNGFV